MLTEKGAENLTAAVPAELEPLYALIKQRGSTRGRSGGERLAVGSMRHPERSEGANTGDGSFAALRMTLVRQVTLVCEEKVAPGIVLAGRDPGWPWYCGGAALIQMPRAPERLRRTRAR